jgi:hypothetical protein
VILLKLLLGVLGLLALLLAITPLLDRFRRRALRRVLRDVAEVLGSHGVTYWADFGTLLGLVREGDLILGDKDVDLCVLDRERPLVMGAAEDFAARGYALTGEGGAKRKLMRVFDRRTPFYADIYPYVPEGDTLRSVLDPRDDVPKDLVKDKVLMVFQGSRVLIPRDTGPLLAYRYGPTYAIPRRNDKGRAGGSGLVHSLLQDLEASALFLWFYLRRALGVGPSRA